MTRSASGRKQWFGWDALESRVALSRTAGFGAVGDSLTDEYRFYKPDRVHARNWVETLAATRDVDFGVYTSKDRGLPRSQGYANNWAKENSTTSDVVASQLAGITQQVSAGKVEFVSVGMGTNDFLFFAEDVASASLAGTTPTAALLATELGTVEANAVANFDTTVDTLLAANSQAKVIVQTTPDIRQVPIVAQYLSVPGASEVVNAIAAAQVEYNAHLRQVAATTPRVALADIASESSAYAGGSAVTLPIGGINLRLTVTGDDYHDVVLADKIHPGTVAQGLIANAVIEAADSLGASIKPLTAKQIINRARSVASHYTTIR